MIKKLLRILGLLALGGPAFAQLATTNTTFSVAVSAPGPGTQGYNAVQLASCTNTVLPSLAGNAVGSFLAVDQEFMQIATLISGTIGGSGTCTVNVKRGQLGSSAVGHNTASKVWVSNQATGSGDNSRPFSGGAFAVRQPSGTCTATLQYSLPVIVTGLADAVNAGVPMYCNDGVWTAGPPLFYQSQPYTNYSTPQNGFVAGASPNTDITDISGQEWFTQINIPQATTLTGLCWLDGTATTDSFIVILWDATGAVVANSAVAGAVAGTASVYNCNPFAFVGGVAGTTVTVGPGTYYAGIQGNGTTAASFWAYNTGVVGATGNTATFQTGIVAAGTFGTVIAIPAASLGSFTTAKGPFMLTY